MGKNFLIPQKSQEQMHSRLLQKEHSNKQQKQLVI